MARYSISYLEGNELLAMRQAVYQGLLTLVSSGTLETSVPIRLTCLTDTNAERIGFKFDFPEVFTQKSPDGDFFGDFFVNFIEGITPAVLAEMIVCEMATHLLLRFGLFILHHAESDSFRDGVWWFRVEQGLDPKRQAILSKSVEELELSMRAYNCLKTANIQTIDDLVGKTYNELLRTHIFGRKWLNEIQEEIGKYGLWLGMSEAEKRTFMPLGS